jgi:hypothetical protein
MCSQNRAAARPTCGHFIGSAAPGVAVAAHTPKWSAPEVRRGLISGPAAEEAAGYWSVLARWMVQAVSRASWGVPVVNPVSRVVSW